MTREIYRHTRRIVEIYPREPRMWATSAELFLRFLFYADLKNGKATTTAHHERNATRCQRAPLTSTRLSHTSRPMQRLTRSSRLS